LKSGTPYATDFEEREDQAQSSKGIKALSVDCIEHNDIMVAGIRFEERMAHIKQLASSTMIKKTLFVQEQELATKWGIGLKDAENAIKATTQNFIQSALHPIERQFRTKITALHYNHLNC
jgi:hypothetical protein